MEVTVALLEAVINTAKQALTIQDAQGRADLWLWEHSERVMRLAQLVAQLPDVAEEPADATVLAAAALYHDAGWAVQVRQGRFDRWQILSRPTNDIQRELGAGLLQEQCQHMLGADVIRKAGQTIRQCNDRNGSPIEAQVLAEAESLDEIGVMYLLRQFRQYQAEGRPLEQLLASWTRQKEYQYWEARIGDSLRFESTRRLARERLTAVDAFMSALLREQNGSDLREALRPLALQK